MHREKLYIPSWDHRTELDFLKLLANLLLSSDFLIYYVNHLIFQDALKVTAKVHEDTIMQIAEVMHENCVELNIKPFIQQFHEILRLQEAAQVDFKQLAEEVYNKRTSIKKFESAISYIGNINVFGINIFHTIASSILLCKKAGIEKIHTIIKVLMHFSNLDINLKAADGNTPLHNATVANNIIMVHALLSFANSHIDVNIRNTIADTPLKTAVCKGFSQIALMLINFPSTSLSLKYGRDKNNILHFAVQRGDDIIVQCLTEQSDILYTLNVRNSKLQYPLDFSFQANTNTNLYSSYGMLSSNQILCRRITASICAVSMLSVYLFIMVQMLFYDYPIAEQVAFYFGGAATIVLFIVAILVVNKPDIICTTERVKRLLGCEVENYESIQPQESEMQLS